MSVADIPILVCSFCEAKVARTTGGCKLTEHLQVWHGITVRREVEMVVERALKGEKSPGWQQGPREDVESEQIGNEEDMPIGSRKRVDQRNGKSMVTTTNMQRIGGEVKEGHKLDGCSAKFARRGNFENHTKKVHGSGALDKLVEHKFVASGAVLAEQNQPSSSLPSPHFENMEGDGAHTYDKKLKNKWNWKETCEECGMVMWKSSLKMHMTTNHTGNQDRPFRCEAPNCGASYTRFWVMKRHMKMFHKESGKGSKRIKSLKLIHSCKIEGCDATFATRRYLRRHVQVFHEGKGEGDV